MVQTETSGLFAILLAAGSSARLGQCKQLVQLGGKSLVRRSAEILVSLDLAGVTVVTGFSSAAVMAELKGLPLDIRYNANWNEGMGSSIASGIRNLPKSAAGVLIATCDQWRLVRSDYLRLISARNTDISAIYSTSYKDRKSLVNGPPVIFPRKLLHELKFTKGIQGAKGLIERNRGLLKLVEMENAAYDLDKQDDLESLFRYSEQYPNS